MEIERLEYKVVLEAPPDTEILARTAHLDMATAAYLTALTRYPKRNVQLRHGARVVRQHDGEPQPEPPKGPDVKAWSAHLIGGKRLRLVGYLEAATEAAAAETAVSLFRLSEPERRRLAVARRR